MWFASCKPCHADDGVSWEFHCFNFSGGPRFCILRKDGFIDVGSWWAIRVLLNKDGELVNCRFWRNVMEPGDVRTTGKRAQAAFTAWVEYRDPSAAIGLR
ncbi:MAG: hypothetical protein AMXMBFR44_3300 [Candidatus Campbellbacteria bacterium]